VSLVGSFEFSETRILCQRKRIKISIERIKAKIVELESKGTAFWFRSLSLQVSSGRVIAEQVRVKANKGIHSILEVRIVGELRESG